MDIHKSKDLYNMYFHKFQNKVSEIFLLPFYSGLAQLDTQLDKDCKTLVQLMHHKISEDLYKDIHRLMEKAHMESDRMLAFHKVAHRVAHKAIRKAVRKQAHKVARKTTHKVAHTMVARKKVVHKVVRMDRVVHKVARMDQVARKE